MSNTLNEAALRALKRTEVQRLAKREGLRAVGTKDALIAALLENCPGGVEPLERGQGAVRRSKRRAPVKVKTEDVDDAVDVEMDDVAEVAHGEQTIYGESISQFVPVRRRCRTPRTVEDAASPRGERIATPPPPSPRRDEASPVSHSVSRASTARASPRGSKRPSPVPPMSRTAAAFFQGSFRPVERPVAALRHQQECLVTGVPIGAAAQPQNHPRVQEGVTLSTQDSLELLEEQNIQLMPRGQAVLDPAAMRANATAVAPPVAQSSAEQPLISAPRPRRIADAPLLGPASWFQPRRPIAARAPAIERLPSPSPLRAPIVRRPAPLGTDAELTPSAVNVCPSPPPRPRAPFLLIDRPVSPPLSRELVISTTVQAEAGPSTLSEALPQAGPSTVPPPRPRGVRPAIDQQPMPRPEDLWAMAPPLQPQPLPGSATLRGQRPRPSTGRRPQPDAGPSTSRRSECRAGLLNLGLPPPAAGPSSHAAEREVRPWRAGLEPNDGRFRMPEVPERVSGARRLPFADLDDDAVAARQPPAPNFQRRPVFAPAPVFQPEASSARQEHGDSLAEEEDSRLDPLYDLFPSSSESSDEESEARGYLATLMEFAKGRPSNGNSEPEVDPEDKRMAALEAEAKAREEEEDSDRMRPVIGGTREQMENIVRRTHRVAVAFEKVEAQKREATRLTKYLEAQSEKLHELRRLMLAKRLTMEYWMTQASIEEGGWESWRPDADRWREIKLEAAASKMRRRLGDPEASVLFEFSHIVDEENGGPVAEEERERAPQPFVLGPAFELRGPSDAPQPFKSSSPLPLSSPPATSPLLVPVRAFPDPITPPRRPRPAPRQCWPDSPDSFAAPSPGPLRSAANHLNVFHPSRILDEAAAREQAEGSWQLDGIPTGLTDVTVPDVGPSTSYAGKKRRRDEEGDVDDGLSSWSSTEEGSDFETENSGAVQTDYRPRPTPGYPGSEILPDETMPDEEPDYPWAAAYTRPPEWRDLRGGRISPSPPKRARHDRA